MKIDIFSRFFGEFSLEFINRIFIFIFQIIYSHRSTSRAVIPEENTDEFWSSNDQSIPNMNNVRVTCNSSLSLPIQQQNEVGDSSQIIRRNESPQSAYSPYGNSPSVEPNNSGYLLMSPGIDYNKT